MQVILGSKRAGTFGIRQLATYDVSDWRMHVTPRNRLVFRPGLRTFSRRLAVTLVLGIMAGWVYLEFVAFSEDATAPAPTPEQVQAHQAALESARALGMDSAEIQRIVQEHEAELAAEREAFNTGQEAVRRTATRIAMALMVLGFLPPLVCLWSEVSLAIGPRGELRVSRISLWSSTQSFNRNELGAVRYEVRETYRRSRHHRVFVGWRWHVYIDFKPIDGGLAEPAAEFWVDFHKEPPREIAGPPDQVRTIVSWLESALGQAAIGPAIVEFSQPEGNFWNARRKVHRRGPPIQTQTISHTSGPVTVQEFTFNSDHEIPEQFRELVKEMRNEATSTGRNTVARSSLRFTVRDDSGNEVTYTSTEDMPDDVRRMFEDAQRQMH
jgi:hypothetical protein